MRRRYKETRPGRRKIKTRNGRPKSLPVLPGLLLLPCLLPLAVAGTGPPDLEAESSWLRERGGTEALYGEDMPPDMPPESEEGTTGQPVPQHAEPEKATGAGSETRERTREELLGEVDLSWARPEVVDRAMGQPDRQEEDAVRRFLKEIFVPKVEFSDLPLSEVVATLGELAAEEAGEGKAVNLVLIDPNGNDPRVSLVLRRLSLLRVLDFVTESVAYSYELQPDAVIIRQQTGPGAGLETAFYPISRSTLIRLTGVPESEEGDTGPVTGLTDPFGPVEESPSTGDGGGRQLERAMKSFLQRAGVAFNGIPGAALALADGQLIVTQTARNHEKVRRLLRRYQAVKQVEIEARFLEVQERNLEELGFEWTLIGTGPDRVSNAPTRNLANAFTVGQDESRIVIDRPGLELPEIGKGAPVMPTTVDLAEGAGNLLRLSGLVEGVEIRSLVRALERQSGNDLLSAPKLTVLSGKTAEITVAEEFRYPESYGDTDAEVGRGDSSSGSAGVAITAGTPRSFRTRNVGVEMAVTPTVENDNAISLNLQPKVTEFEGFVEYGGTSVAIASDTTVTVPSGFYQPIFSVREVETEVTIWDGATVILGGLTREHSVRVSDRIPLLGDIPLLGRLFRNEGESTQKRNLLIFVTANLVSPGGSPAFQFVPGVEPNSLFQKRFMKTPGGPRRR